MILFILLAYAQAQCQNSPYLPQFQYLAEKYGTNPSQYNRYLTMTPQAQNLTICTQMQSSSCCDAAIESYFTTIVSNYQAGLLDVTFPLENIITKFQTQINTCMGSKYIINTTLTQYRQLIMNIINLKSGFLLGNLCVLCTQYNNATFIDQITNKTILQSSNYQTYKSNLANNYTALQTLIQSYKINLMYFYINYTNTLYCSQLLDDFDESFNTVNICSNCMAAINQTIELLDGSIRFLNEEDYFIQQTVGLIGYIAYNLSFQSLLAVTYMILY